MCKWQDASSHIIMKFDSCFPLLTHSEHKSVIHAAEKTWLYQFKKLLQLRECLDLLK